MLLPPGPLFWSLMLFVGYLTISYIYKIHGTSPMTVQQPQPNPQQQSLQHPQHQQPYNTQAPNMHLNQFTTQSNPNTGTPSPALASNAPPQPGQLNSTGNIQPNYPNQYQMSPQGPQQAPIPQAQGFVKKTDDPSFSNAAQNVPKPQVPVNPQFNLPPSNNQLIPPNAIPNTSTMPGSNNVKILQTQSNINLPINQTNTVMYNSSNQANSSQQTVLIKQQAQSVNSTANPQMITQQQNQHQIVQQNLSSQTIPFIPTTQTVQMMPNKPMDQTKPLESLGKIVQLQQNPQQMANMNQSGQQQVYLGGQTASFIDQQQQLIQDNLNPKLLGTASPAKKLTKKQLKKLNAGEDLSDTTPTKKTTKQRKIVPKKGSLNNSLSSSGSQTDLNKEGVNGDETAAAGDSSQQAKIDATIDDFMKQYKMKTKKKKTDK